MCYRVTGHSTSILMYCREISIKSACIRDGEYFLITRSVHHAVKARLDASWYIVSQTQPFVRDVLINKWGFAKTGESVTEFGRKAVIYYECDDVHRPAIEAYLAKGSAWLGHQIGSHIPLKYGSSCLYCCAFCHADRIPPKAAC